MPRRKRSAWGTLTRVDSSTWRLRYWATGPDGAYKRRSRTIRGTRLDAERVRSELMLAHSDDAPCPTVGEVWERYALPDLQRRVDGGDVSENTLKRYQSVWRTHIAPSWSGIQCDAVRALAVQQWLYGMALNAARQALQLLRLILDYAVRYECCDHNVARERYLMPSKSTVTQHDKGTWSLDELGEVWHRAAHGTWWEPSFICQAFGGLRLGESMAVRSEDVSLVTVDGVPVALVRVERQIPHVGNQPTDQLKTPRSRRTVAIPGRAGVRLAAIADAADGWLTSDGMGGAVTQKRLVKCWHESMERLDDSLRHPIRNLRNSWQTNLRWSMRIPPYLIEPMMGHSAGGITGEHYDRPQAQMFAEAMVAAYAAHPYDAGWDWV